MPRRRFRVLLTEGSSLSARQTLYALGAAGHHVDVCDPHPWLCLARYSRFTRRVFRCPSFTTQPLDYVRFLLRRLETEHYDVLIPVHDQVFLLAKFRKEFARCVGLPLPDFAVLERLQSKSAFLDVLAELGLPHPNTLRVRSRQEMERAASFPVYVKLPYSTAGCGVWLTRNIVELRQAADRLQTLGLFDGLGEVLLQQPALGDLCVAQSIFQDGRLVAVHTYQARALGVGGSAWARVSVDHPLVREHLRRIGAHLCWHGALMLDYVHDPATGQPSYIDANPRIGETFNATLAGVNLCDTLVRVGCRDPIAELRITYPGVSTHGVMMSLLAKARDGATRCELLAELGNARAGRGLYADSSDELTRPREDLLSLLPAAYLVARLLIHPGSASDTITRTVKNYALDETSARAIRALSADALIDLPPE